MDSRVLLGLGALYVVGNLACAFAVDGSPQRHRHGASHGVLRGKPLGDSSERADSPCGIALGATQMRLRMRQLYERFGNRRSSTQGPGNLRLPSRTAIVLRRDKTFHGTLGKSDGGVFWRLTWISSSPTVENGWGNSPQQPSIFK